MHTNKEILQQNEKMHFYTPPFIVSVRGIVLVALFLLFFHGAGVSEVPSELFGVWQGDDRILFFDESGDFSVILKLYYGWYYDVASDKNAGKDFSGRNRNAATSRSAQTVLVDFETYNEMQNCYEMTLDFGRGSTSKIPVALIDNCLYLDFLICTSNGYGLSMGVNGALKTASLEQNAKAENSAIFGFWQGVNSAENIRIAERKHQENMYSWYIANDSVYRIRFWKTAMEYSENAEAIFTDGESVFSVKKHIFSGGQNYTCTSGRGTRIRNIDKFSSFPFDFVLSEDRKIIAFKTRYFTKMDVSSREDVIKIVEEANSRRKPDHIQ